MKIGLLGISFETGNLGVNALAESTVQCILSSEEDVEVCLLASGTQRTSQHVRINGKKVVLHTYPIRFSKNILNPDHFIRLLFGLIFFRMFKIRRKSKNKECTGTLSALWGCDLIADITGGDSFSDIYGFRRFFLGFCRKWLVLLAGKKLIMLPQTYGPYQGKLSRLMARFLLKRTRIVYSRDQKGVDYLRSILPRSEYESKVRLCPDVAFVLEPKVPEAKFLEWPTMIQKQGGILIGLNLSALLFNGGYTRDNMFGLKVSYQEFVRTLIHRFLQKKEHYLMLIDHVCPGTGHIENDPDVSRKVFYELTDSMKERMYHPEGNLDQGQVKYLIGQCEFFAGSRMHACIGALSQNVPTAGLAYSDKFRGVFQTVDMDKAVVDLRECSNAEAIEQTVALFENRKEIKDNLAKEIPQTKKQVLSLFQDIL